VLLLVAPFAFWAEPGRPAGSSSFTTATRPSRPAHDAGERGTRLRRKPGVGQHRQGFERAFPDAGVSAATVASALASFERTVVSGEAPFDRWVAGERGAISDRTKRGFVLFDSRAKCSKCHSGWRFTDESFHEDVLRARRGRGPVLPRD